MFKHWWLVTRLYLVSHLFILLYYRRPYNNWEKQCSLTFTSVRWAFSLVCSLTFTSVRWAFCLVCSLTFTSVRWAFSLVCSLTFTSVRWAFSLVYFILSVNSIRNMGFVWSFYNCIICRSSSRYFSRTVVY